MSDRERFGPSRGDAMSTDVVTADGRARVLADGNEIPLVGLGVWQVANDREGVDAVRWALELGYRHIDTAQAYGNEESVGQGLRESGVPRAEVFITTKFSLGYRRVRELIGGFEYWAREGLAIETDAGRTRRPADELTGPVPQAV